MEKGAEAHAPETKESPKKKESNEPRLKEKKQKNKNKESTNSSAGSVPQETAKESENNQQQSKAEPSKAEKKRKKIIIIGDSILSSLGKLGLQRNHNVRVRAHPGATSRDIIDHIKPAARKQPDCIIIHAESNDLTNGVNTIQNLKMAIEEAKKESPNTDFVLSTITLCKDEQALDLRVDVNKANDKIKDLAKKLNLKVIENTNIDMLSLGRKKLHLNQRGYSFLAGNFIRFSKSYWTSNSVLSNSVQKIKVNDTSIQNLSADTYVSQFSIENEAESFIQLKSLRLKYQKYIIIGYININWMRNKFESFSLMMKDNLDVLIIAETKIDSTFPDSQFQILG